MVDYGLVSITFVPDGSSHNLKPDGERIQTGTNGLKSYGFYVAAGKGSHIDIRGPLNQGLLILCFDVGNC